MAVAAASSICNCTESASHYRIRKAHAPHQLSSLEAAAYALMQLEGRQAPFERLLAGFDGFVAQQAAYARRA